MLHCDGKYYSRQGQENKIAFTILKCPSFQFYSLVFLLALGELFICYSAVSKIRMCQLLSHKYKKVHFLVWVVPETYCVVEQHIVFSLHWHGNKCFKVKQNNNNSKKNLPQILFIRFPVCIICKVPSLQLMVKCRTRKENLMNSVSRKFSAKFMITKWL